MIRVCSGNNAAAVGTNYLLGVASRFGKSLDWIVRGEGFLRLAQREVIAFLAVVNHAFQ